MMAKVIVTETVSEETPEIKEVAEVAPKYTEQETDSYIKKLRSENEKLRKESLSKLEKEKEAKKQAMEEQGKYKELYENTLKEAEAEKSKVVNIEKRNALRLALRDAQAKHPELLEGLFKTNDGWSFELDETGKIVDLDNVLKPVAEKYADSFGKTVIKGQDPQVGSGTEDFYTQSQMEAMSESDMAINFDKVEKSLQMLNK